MTAAALLTAAFLFAVAVSVCLRVWLAMRQAGHVARHRDCVPAEFADGISLPDHQKAADYTGAKIRLSLIHLAAETALLLGLTLGGLLQVFDTFWADALGSRGYLHGLALFASLAALGFLVDLPFSLYRTFVIEARFGFNRMSWRLFLADLARQLLLACAIGVPLLLAVLWLMAAMGPLWWFHVWLLWLGFNLLVLLLYPTLIAPLFNKFEPMPTGALKLRIEGLLQRCGFTASGLFVMDGSKRSAHGNAYFMGLGKSKRIVFFDTLIAKLSIPEVEAVLAHELGHFRRRHVLKRMLWMSATSLVLLWLLGRLIDQPWFYQGLGVTQASTAMALILFSQALPVFLFPLAPIASWFSRRHEYEADAYAAGQANAGDLISALVKLYRDNAATLTPDPLHSMFYDSHPPASLRIARLRPAR